MTVKIYGKVSGGNTAAPGTQGFLIEVEDPRGICTYPKPSDIYDTQGNPDPLLETFLHPKPSNTHPANIYYTFYDSDNALLTAPQRYCEAAALFCFYAEFLRGKKNGGSTLCDWANVIADGPVEFEIPANVKKEYLPTIGIPDESISRIIQNTTKIIQVQPNGTTLEKKPADQDPHDKFSLPVTRQEIPLAITNNTNCYSGSISKLLPISSTKRHSLVNAIRRKIHQKLDNTTTFSNNPDPAVAADYHSQLCDNIQIDLKFWVPHRDGFDLDNLMKPILDGIRKPRHPGEFLLPKLNPPGNFIQTLIDDDEKIMKIHAMKVHRDNGFGTTFCVRPIPTVGNPANGVCPNEHSELTPQCPAWDIEKNKSKINLLPNPGAGTPPFSSAHGQVHWTPTTANSHDLRKLIHEAIEENSNWSNINACITDFEEQIKSAENYPLQLDISFRKVGHLDNPPQFYDLDNLIGIVIDAFRKPRNQNEASVDTKLSDNTKIKCLITDDQWIEKIHAEKTIVAAQEQEGFTFCLRPFIRPNGNREADNNTDANDHLIQTENPQCVHQHFDTFPQCPDLPQAHPVK